MCFAGWTYLAFAMMSVTTAMLCKEQGITVTGICAIYELFVVQKVRAHLNPFAKKMEFRRIFFFFCCYFILVPFLSVVVLCVCACISVGREKLKLPKKAARNPNCHKVDRRNSNNRKYYIQGKTFLLLATGVVVVCAAAATVAAGIYPKNNQCSADFGAKYGAFAAMHIEWETIYIVVECMDDGVKETLNCAIFNDDWITICPFQSDGLSVASIHKVSRKLRNESQFCRWKTFPKIRYVALHSVHSTHS